MITWVISFNDFLLKEPTETRMKFNILGRSATSLLFDWQVNFAPEIWLMVKCFKLQILDDDLFNVLNLVPINSYLSYWIPFYYQPLSCHLNHMDTILIVSIFILFPLPLLFVFLQASIIPMLASPISVKFSINWIW